MRWIKVVGNAGVAFFSALLGYTTANYFSTYIMFVAEEYRLLFAILVTAFIQGGLSFCKEMTKEEEQAYKRQKTRLKGASCLYFRVLDKMTLI